MATTYHDGPHLKDEHCIGCCGRWHVASPQPAAETAPASQLHGHPATLQAIINCKDCAADIRKLQLEAEAHLNAGMKPATSSEVLNTRMGAPASSLVERPYCDPVCQRGHYVAEIERLEGALDTVREWSTGRNRSWSRVQQAVHDYDAGTREAVD